MYVEVKDSPWTFTKNASYTIQKRVRNVSMKLSEFQRFHSRPIEKKTMDSIIKNLQETVLEEDQKSEKYRH